MAKNCPLVEGHASDGFTRVHQVEGFIDFLKRHRVGDEIVDVDFLFHVPINDLWNICAAPRAAEGRPFPYPSGDELKWILEIRQWRSTPFILTIEKGDVRDGRHWRTALQLRERQEGT
jgi:hypothetical protein